MTDTPLTPDVVNAIVRDMDDPRFPSRITVFCDHCGAEHTGEYMVSEEMTSTERLDVARTHLVANEGWEHTDTGDDFCPEHAGTKPSTPDRPYTDADLRLEAIRQHYIATIDPDFMGIGEQMDSRFIDSTLVDPDPQTGTEPVTGTTWDQLDRKDFETAHRAVDDLLAGAADVSEWAINLGADGLEPSSDVVNLANNDDTPFVRLHFAFNPDMTEESQQRFVLGVREAIAKAI